MRAVQVLQPTGPADVRVVDVPEPYLSVGWWYQEFAQTTDDEVRALLARSRS